MSNPSFGRALVAFITLVLVGCAHTAPKVGCDGPLRPINAITEQPGPDDAKAKREASSNGSREAASDEAAHGR